ncbi:winged helix-turn-helix domain-containing protein [Streptomyces sp. NPDC093707]|uniref:winged helix-turn-helix domain-containing protein n=1 Tax=Streptomyces sp. NPDC093707 TaxID=3154984 RepID=UPI00344BCB4D
MSCRTTGRARRWCRRRRREWAHRTWLRRHGITPQWPARRSYRQQPQAVRAWSEEECPAIAVRVKREQAELVRADRADPAGTGQRPPLQRQHHACCRLTCGALWFTVLPGKFTSG